MVESDCMKMLAELVAKAMCWAFCRRGFL